MKKIQKVMGKIIEVSFSGIMNNAESKGIVIPGFNIPYIPMMEPVHIQILSNKS